MQGAQGRCVRGVLTFWEPGTLGGGDEAVLRTRKGQVIVSTCMRINLGMDCRLWTREVGSGTYSQWQYTRALRAPEEAREELRCRLAHLDVLVPETCNHSVHESRNACL